MSSGRKSINGLKSLGRFIALGKSYEKLVISFNTFAIDLDKVNCRDTSIIVRKFIDQKVRGITPASLLEYSSIYEEFMNEIKPRVESSTTSTTVRKHLKDLVDLLDQMNKIASDEEYELPVETPRRDLGTCRILRKEDQFPESIEEMERRIDRELESKNHSNRPKEVYHRKSRRASRITVEEDV